MTHNGSWMRLAALLLLSPLLCASPLDEAEALAKAGHWKRARTALGPSMKAPPEEARTLWLVSRVQLAFGEKDAAVKTGERAAALDPRNSEYQYHLAEVYGTIAHEAPIWRQLGPGRKCKQAMDAAYRLDPAHVENLFILMQYYRRAPGFMGGDRKRANALAETIRQLDPARGWMAAAVLAGLDKDVAGQRSALEKAVEVNPQHYAARIELATFLRSQRDWAGMARHAEEAIRIHPDRGAAHRLRAVAAVHVGGLDEVLTEAERKAPDDLSPYLAAANELDGRSEQARKLLERYRAQEPEAIFPK